MLIERLDSTASYLAGLALKDPHMSNPMSGEARLLRELSLRLFLSRSSSQGTPSGDDGCYPWESDLIAARRRTDEMHPRLLMNLAEAHLSQVVLRWVSTTPVAGEL